MSARVGRCLVFACFVSACSETPGPVERTTTETTTGARAVEEEAVGAVGLGGPFVDRTVESGLDFVHWNGMTGGYYYAEMMGAGGALFDYDGDGDLDLFLVQSAALGDASVDETVDEAVFPVPEHGLGDRLYRNDSDRADSIRFVDVTAEALGEIEPGYGMGVAVADFDADGHPDLYLTRFGRNRHLRNTGDGRFEDVTDDTTGLGRWGVPAVPFDADGDGDVDLFVGHYVEYTVAADKPCLDELGRRDYCGPLAYPGERDALLLNRGDGTFEDVSGRAGLDAGPGSFGAALGAVALDYDSDGRLDLYVANDGTPNQLWRNLGPGPDGVPRFEERAVPAGVAVNGQGQPEASMGVALVDVDQDGDEDLFLTHLRRETNTLYLADGHGGFVDHSAPSGLGAPSFDRTAFGCAFADLDHDGLLDLVTVAGAVKGIRERVLAGDPYPLAQPNQLFRGVTAAPDRPRFEVWPAGEPFDREAVSRGVILGDVDGDGDIDAVVTNNAGPARLLVNVAADLAKTGADERSWLGLRLVDAVGSDVPGALATLVLDDGRRLLRRVGANASYASSSEPRLHFTLAAGPDSPATPSAVEVTWPGGARERFPAPVLGSTTVLRRGAGELLSETFP